MSHMVPIQQADAQAIAEIAELHARSIRSALAELGPGLTKYFYQVAARDPAALGYVLYEGEKIAGFVFGCSDPAATLNCLRRRPLALGWALLRRPKLLWSLVASRLQGGSVRTVAPGTVELMYIAVDPGHRGKGLGVVLIQAFLDSAKKSGAGAVSLSVETHNKFAIDLYRLQGFEEKALMREGQYDRLRMVRSL